MITVSINGRLAEIKAFAQQNDLEENFNNTFARLERWFEKTMRLTLHKIKSILINFPIIYFPVHIEKDDL
jgi:hypothetical protein